ncbi:F-box protein [Senna tora]|uniref:F-box protein n=1 Tax=Senna tora TaxID=362788 RepID=A0A834WHS4_9FABA|nr:F-box protein [Senna tora]
MTFSSAPPPTTVDGDGASTISAVHPDVIQTQILNRLDGATLASAACASSHLRGLCNDDTLWRNICTATWPSLHDPRVRHVVSGFPGGHRSLFSDSFPTLHHVDDHPDRSFPTASDHWISAVDLYYRDTPIFSKVIRTETRTGWFGSSPLWIDLLDPNELVPTPLVYARKDEDWMRQRHLEENLSVSWILIDPTRNRAANLSSRKAVSAKRNWFSRDLELVYAVVIACEGRAAREWVQCNIKVTCCGEAGGEMHVREVSLMVEDTEGRNICGEESMVILQRAIENGKRERVKEEEAKAREEKNTDTFNSQTVRYTGKR